VTHWFGQLLFAMAWAAGVAWLVSYVMHVARRPVKTPGGEVVVRVREGRVLSGLVVAVGVAVFAAVLIVWPTS
jgi:hypothetical protein